MGEHNHFFCLYKIDAFGSYQNLFPFLGILHIMAFINSYMTYKCHINLYKCLTYLFVTYKVIIFPYYGFKIYYGEFTSLGIFYVKQSDAPLQSFQQMMCNKRSTCILIKFCTFFFDIRIHTLFPRKLPSHGKLI